MRDLSGVHVVVTGVIGGESRRTAEDKLRDVGAVVQSSVGQSTDLLVTGGRVGKTKMDAARKGGVELVVWDDLWHEAYEIGGADDPAYHRELRPQAPLAKLRAYGPMLCKADELPSGPGWLYEVKWDGLRCIARVAGGTVSMTSRSAKSNYVGQFPHIAALLAKWPDVVVDGELVVLDAEGGSSLASIGNKTGGSFIVFDLLELEGEVLTQLPLETRRALLGGFFEGLGDGDQLGGRIALSPTFDNGEALLRTVVARRLEGVVAKRRAGRYVEGHRGWTKVKLRNEQEFVVLGWVPGNGALAGKIGGLALGVREKDRWLYVGRAGSGPTDQDRRRLMELLEPLRLDEKHPEIETGKAPRAELREIVWVEPELIVNVAFQRWSKDGRLVIPSLKGVRNDKTAMEVTRKA